MRKVILISVRAVISITLLLIIFNLIRPETDIQIDEQTITDSKVNNAYDLLYETLDNEMNSYFKEDYNFSYGDKTYIAESADSKSIAYEESVNYNVTVEESGFYNIEVDYLIDELALINSNIMVSINGEYQFDEAKLVDVPMYFEDETKDFTLDTYGDETLPILKQISKWRTLSIFNNLYYTDKPLLFYLEEGENVITILNASSNKLQFGDLRVVSPSEVVEYKDYKKDEEPISELTFVNAIDYVQKNSSHLRMNSFNDPSVEPYNSVDKLLNVIDGTSWNKAGQEVTFEVNVEKSGNYYLSFHYMNDKDDFSVFRTIKIDGQAPFKELISYEFPPTKTNSWTNHTLGGDVPYHIYLEEGTHTITLKAEMSNVAKEIESIRLLINHINQFALEVVKITGKEVDINRTWNITKYIPETIDYLNSYETIIKRLMFDLSKYAPNGLNSATLSYLNTALESLERMSNDPDNLPIYLVDLYSGTGSVTQMLGDSMTRLMEQPMYLDGLYLHGETKLPSANASFIKTLLSNSRSFFATFTSKKYVIKNDPNALNIWVNRPITHVDTLQKLVDSDFTKKTGIKVKISVMPDPNKLILAASAGNTPDVSLGTLSYMPFDFAIRDAAYDLTNFDDFWEYADRFAPGSIVPYIYNDGVYAIPETLDFNALVYRKDIFSSLDLSIPNTWDEVIDILPELQRYGMNFYHPIADGRTSLKWFYQTAPFIYLHNGELYSKDGTRTTIDSQNSVEGINYLVDLFKKYSLPTQVMIFSNSFRYSTVPVGIVDFNNYLQIKNTAPELVGQWELSKYPGIEQEDGSIDRWFIANGTNGMIFNDSKRKEDSWKFMKWWMSTETQTTYSYNLQSTFGPEYVWLSGNKEALANAPIENNHKQIIIDSVEWIRDVPRTPGQYMLERGLSDIWNKAVFDNYSTRVVVDMQTLTVNREVERKMIEFGFIDEDGNQLKEFKIRDIDWIQEQIDNAKVGG